MREFFVVTTILVSVLTLLTSPLQVAAQNTDPESVLRGIFEDALNAKDIDRALASVADDAVITIIQGPNQIVFTGKEEIRGWWQQTQVAENTFIQVSNFHVDGDKATWFARVSADPFRALGVDFVNCTCETVVQGGLLRSHTLTITAESIAKIQIATNKALIRRYFEALSGKEKPVATVEEYVAAEDEELKQHIAFFEASFPRYELIAEDMIAEGDKVTVHARFQGAHTGALGDIPPTGKQVSQPFIITYRIVDGKIVEHWMSFDQLALMQQLGVIPPPGEGGK
jgi:predicted ester cyclase